jgi:hypothetical protein
MQVMLLGVQKKKCWSILYLNTFQVFEDHNNRNKVSPLAISQSINSLISHGNETNINKRSLMVLVKRPKTFYQFALSSTRVERCRWARMRTCVLIQNSKDCAILRLRIVLYQGQPRTSVMITVTDEARTWITRTTYYSSITNSMNTMMSDTRTFACRIRNGRRTWHRDFSFQQGSTPAIHLMLFLHNNYYLFELFVSENKMCWRSCVF